MGWEAIVKVFLFMAVVLLVVGAILIFLGKNLSYIYMFINKSRDILNKKTLSKMWNIGIVLIILGLFSMGIGGLIHVFALY